MLTWPDTPLTSDARRHLAALVERRRRGEPIAYILGRQGFWTLDLEVTPDTLIPRPETELLVELALDRLPAGAPLTVADLGTGSGAIAAALASRAPGLDPDRPGPLPRPPSRSPGPTPGAWGYPTCCPWSGDWFGPLAPGKPGRGHQQPALCRRRRPPPGARRSALRAPGRPGQRPGRPRRHPPHRRRGPAPPAPRRPAGPGARLRPGCRGAGHPRCCRPARDRDPARPGRA